MEQKHCAKGQILAQRGARLPSLFFINAGKVELSIQEKDRDVPIRVAGPGEIIGADTFFEASVWTIAARSLGAQVFALHHKALDALEKIFPGIDSRLCDYSSRFKIPKESIVKKGHDRRLHERFRIDGKIELVLFDREGNESEIKARAVLFDISAGGVSFFLRISKRETARLLLGRRVGLILHAHLSSKFSITGDIVAVRSQPVVGNEYAVSVQFSRMLALKELRDILAISRNSQRIP